jgi:hypothetical protein
VLKGIQLGCFNCSRMTIDRGSWGSPQVRHRLRQSLRADREVHDRYLHALKVLALPWAAPRILWSCGGQNGLTAHHLVFPGPIRS